MSIRTLTTSLRALTEARANHFAPSHHSVAQAALKGVNRVVKPREVSCSSQLFLPTSTLGQIPASAGIEA